MKSLWDAGEAATYDGDLGLRVYSSRLLGRDPSLVLHGGGNTSVKVTEKNLFEEEEDILYIKGSGWDLETIESAGFAPVRLAPVVRLAELPSLSDPQMVNALRTYLKDASAPSPSVETILHGVLPFRFVDHTHADAVVTITNTQAGEQRIQELYGDTVVIVPYIMPGFLLAKACAQIFPAQAGPQTVGMVLMNHGLFTFGDSAREAYERMIALVDQAEKYLKRQGAWNIASPDMARRASPDISTIADLRKRVSDAAEAPMLLSFRDDGLSLHFAGHPDIGAISQQGPATPDHVIRTKRLPQIGRDVSAYEQAYRAYFARHAPEGSTSLTMLDPAPRVILDADWGVGAVGRTARAVGIVEDIYHHTMEIILRAQALGGYRALPSSDLFEMEYWDLEQAKLRRGGPAPEFTGEIALVTGAASGIGRASAQALMQRGATVIGLDVNPDIVGQWDRPDFLGLQCDVTEPEQVEGALESGVKRYGGLDMVVLNAGIFSSRQDVAPTAMEAWRRVLEVNLDTHLVLLRQLYPLLKLAPRSGRVVVIGFKNTPAPGAGAPANPVSRTLLTELARVVALEWARDGIRVNVVHPNAVSDTAIWPEEVLKALAASSGSTIEEYKRSNPLGAEVKSSDLAELVADMCGPLFRTTTGAQVSLDGGNDLVI